MKETLRVFLRRPHPLNHLLDLLLARSEADQLPIAVDNGALGLDAGVDFTLILKTIICDHRFENLKSLLSGCHYLKAKNR